MIVTEAGADPKVASLVYVAARAPDAGEDYATLAKQFPSPPASAGIVWSGDYGQLSEQAFLRDFAGDLPAEKARVLYAVQEPFKRALLAGRTTHAAWRPNRGGTPFRRRTERSIPSFSALWPSGWARRPLR